MKYGVKTKINSWELEAVVRRCSVKKAFLEIFQNSQENTCARVSFLIKLQAWGNTYISPETIAVFSRPTTEIVWRIYI